MTAASPLAPHAPDPQFAAHLEWQLLTAARRASRFDEPATAARGAWRPLRVAALLLLAMGIGACGVLAAQQIRRERAAELLAVQYQVRFEIARLREEAARDEVTQLMRANEQGLGSAQECYAAEGKRIELAQEASLLGLDAIEVAATGEEPDRRLSASLVSGRDLVTERLEQSLAALRFRVSAATRRREELERLHEKGFVPDGDVEQARLREDEESRQSALSETLKELRARFLRGELDAGRVDLLALREEATARREQVRQELAAAAAAAQRARQLAAAGAVAEGEARAAEQAARLGEARLRLADLEVATIAARLDPAR